MLTTLLHQGLPQMAQGLLVTVEMGLQATVGGIVVGLLVGLGLLYVPVYVRWIFRVYVDVVRGLPPLVLIFSAYYLIPVSGINVSAFYSGVFALAFFSGAHFAEVVRGGIDSIPQTQTQAAKAIGLRFWPLMWWILLPQAVRRMVPPAINATVEVIKGTSLVSLIGVVELVLATQQFTGSTFIVIPAYGLAALMYFVVNFSISRLGGVFERRYAYLQY